MFEFLLAPKYFKPLPKPILAGLSFIILTMFSFAFYQALVISPVDYQQGETVRIMYVHVPAAWLSMMVYALMAFMGISFLAFKTPVAMVIAHAAAPIGAVFTGITLITGMIWGKPMWGAWWVWDARLTSVLLLFFLYLGYIALAQAGGYGERSFKSSAILAIVGAVNLPVIKFSVEWWNTLHQPASIIRAGGTAIHPSMLTPLLAMFAAYTALFLLLLYMRITLTLRQQKRFTKKRRGL